MMGTGNTIHSNFKKSLPGIILGLTFIFSNISSAATPSSKVSRKFSKTTEKNFKRDFEINQMGQYSVAGKKVRQYLLSQFLNLGIKTPLEIAQKLDQNYSDKLRPGALESRTLKAPGQLDFYLWPQVQALLEMRKRYVNFLNESPKARLQLQNADIGILHLLDTHLKSDSMSGNDELWKIRKYLISQDFFRPQEKSETSELIWDWMLIRAHGYPLDLVDKHLQKVENVARNTSHPWPNILKNYETSLALLSIKKMPQTNENQEAQSKLALKLLRKILPFVDVNEHKVLREIKVQTYRLLQQTGQSVEAQQLKKEIATELFSYRVSQLGQEVKEVWNKTTISFMDRLISIFSVSIRGLIHLLTYLIGLLFVATPIEFLLITVALIMLSKQGHVFFEVKTKSLRMLWREHRLLEKKGYRRVLKFSLAVCKWFVNYMKVAWKMFMASYSNTATSFYSKLATSLLIFGIGLYFNSARNLVESLVGQLSL